MAPAVFALSLWSAGSRLFDASSKLPPTPWLTRNSCFNPGRNDNFLRIFQKTDISVYQFLIYRCIMDMKGYGAFQKLDSNDAKPKH